MSGAAESDEILLDRYVRGEAAAFAALYHRHEMRVWRYLLRNVGNRAIAEELMQEVWFAVARDAARLEPDSRFVAWLFAIARHRMIDLVRSRRPQLSLDVVGHQADCVVEALTAQARAEPLPQAVARDEAAAIARALRQIPREQRDAFLLQLEGDLTVDEVASITGSSFEATKSRLRYARSKLRELLGEYA
jgi:RNA polymerase sigma factor (sigma-70 family)